MCSYRAHSRIITKTEKEPYTKDMEAKSGPKYTAEKYTRYAMAASILILVALVILLVTEYRTLEAEQQIIGRSFWSPHILTHRAPLPVSNAGVIRSWMTFDYLNRLFALPPDYLREQLHITNTHYPRLTIAAFAKGTGTDPAATLDAVQNAVRSYPPTSAASPTTSSTPPAKST